MMETNKVRMEMVATNKMNQTRRLIAALAVTALTVVGHHGQAQAQTWPQKPVTIILPFPPGGATDMLGRELGASMQKSLGQTFVVDNRPGATGTIGTGMVKRAAPDGYTLLVASLAPFVISPHLVKNLPYDPRKDLDLLTVAVQAPNVLVVPAASPYKTVADVIAALKKNPDKLTFSSSGNGASDHLTAVFFWQQTDTKGVHVPYKGGAPAIADLIGGQVDASFQNVNAILGHVESGKLRALAVTGSARSQVLPQVPTLDEAGVSGIDVYSWQGVAAPKGLAPDLKQRIHAAIMAALRDPAVAEKFTRVGLEIVANTPEQFATFQQKEFARWKEVIEKGKITAD